MANPNGDARKDPNIPLIPERVEMATTGLGILSLSANQVPRAPLPPVSGPSGPMEPPKIRPIRPRIIPTRPLRGSILPLSVISPISSASSCGLTLVRWVMKPTKKPPRRQAARMNKGESTPSFSPKARGTISQTTAVPNLRARKKEKVRRAPDTPTTPDTRSNI